MYMCRQNKFLSKDFWFYRKYFDVLFQTLWKNERFSLAQTKKEYNNEATSS